MNEIGIPYGTTGKTLWVSVQNSVNQFYNALASSFEDENDANFTAAKYCIAATELGTSRYYEATFPVVAAGVYTVVAHLQAGGSPAVSDQIILVGTMNWNGTAEILEFDSIEINGLLGKFSGMRNTVYSGGNLVSYDLCLYDTSGHATTNDGSTGLLHKYSVTNIYDGSGNLQSSVSVRVS